MEKFAEKEEESLKTIRTVQKCFKVTTTLSPVSQRRKEFETAKCCAKV